MIKKIIIASAITFATFAPFAFAESHPIQDNTDPISHREKFSQRVDDKKIALTERRENRAEKVSLHQDKVQALRLEFKAKHDEFKAKISEIKDNRKKIIIERVDSRLATINQNWAQRMNSSILKMEALLDKFAARAAQLKKEGKNTTEAENAITEAESAIQAAKDAVAQQEVKEYVADLTDEENLKSSVGSAMTELRKDLKAAHDIVKIAKQKVIDVARSLAKINKSSSLPTTEPALTSSPSATEAPGI